VDWDLQQSMLEALWKDTVFIDAFTTKKKPRPEVLTTAPPHMQH